MSWNGLWNEHWPHPVHCVRSGQIPETLVQVERVVRPSSSLLIRGLGVRVPGGAPVLNCSNSILWPAMMAGRETNSLRCFDAQGDHSAQPLVTHSDRIATSTGGLPVARSSPAAQIVVKQDMHRVPSPINSGRRLGSAAPQMTARPCHGPPPSRAAGAQDDQQTAGDDPAWAAARRVSAVSPARTSGLNGGPGEPVPLGPAVKVSDPGFVQFVVDDRVHHGFLRYLLCHSCRSRALLAA